MLPAYIFGFGGHDAHIHGLWTKHFARLLAEGDLYPRHSNDLGAGFGSYPYYFYPPISLYMGSIFAFLGSDYNFYYTTISASATLALFLSGLSAYYYLKDKIAANHAIIYALLHMVLPVHLLVDFYITAGISQFWSYVWLPLILLGIEKITKNEKYGTPIFAVSLALLFMTNIPAAILFTPTALLYALILSRHNLWRLAPRCLLAAALSAVYIFPILVYQPLVNVYLHWTKDGYFYYENFFLDKKFFSNDIKESYRMTIALCGVISYICLIFLLLRMPADRVKNMIIAVSTIVLILCFSFSNFIWQVITPLQLIQFPRRLLMIPCVFVILAAGRVDNLMHDKIRHIFIIFIIVFVVASGVIAKKRASDMNSEEVIELRHDFERGIEAFPVYLPGKDVVHYFYPLSPELENHPEVEISKGSVLVQKWQSRDIQIEATAKAGAILKIRQFYFPYWKAYIQAVQVPISRGKPAGIMQVAIDKDMENGIVEFKLETLPAEKLGIFVSAIGFILLILTIARDARKKPL